MSNDLAIIKERIYVEDKIEDILEYLDCEHIKKRGNRWESQLPVQYNSNNRRSVQVYDNEHLTCVVRSRGIKGDIYTLVGYISFDYKATEDVQENLFKIKEWICTKLGWSEYLVKSRGNDFEEIEVQEDHLSFLRTVKKDRNKRKNKKKFLSKENGILDKDMVYSRYIELPHENFLKDGINLETQHEFEVMFDLDSERVVFPIYNQYGDLVSIKGRYVGKNKRIMNEVKYIYLYSFDKTLELFNWYKALPYIKESGRVYLFESEKSVMKAWQYGYKNCVAFCGSDFSLAQLKLLKQVDAELVFCFDKDVDFEHIQNQTSMINTRKCLYIRDEDDLLSDKDSPVDGGKAIWQTLVDKYIREIRS